MRFSSSKITKNLHAESQVTTLSSHNQHSVYVMVDGCTQAFPRKKNLCPNDTNEHI